MAQFREAVRIAPNFLDGHNNFGDALLQEGQVEAAIAEYRDALSIDPTSSTAHYNLGVALSREGRIPEAIEEFGEVVRINPAYPEARYDLGNALLQQGDAAAAIAQMKIAWQLQPSNPTIENALAWMLATASPTSLRDGARAVQLATQAIRTAGGNNPVILRTLAAAYAQEGQCPNAVHAAQRALQLVQAQQGRGGDRRSAEGGQDGTALASALSREIELYKAGSPFSEAH
jgi:tetratricopeptide (TPR) repeat protein